MSTDQEIKVNYLLEVIDKATATVEKIEKSMGSLQKSADDANKVLGQLGKSQLETTKQAVILNNQLAKSTVNATKKQTSFLEKLKNIKDTVLEMIDVFSDFVTIIANFDFKKIAKFLVLISHFLKLKGFDKLGNFLRSIAVQMAKFAVYAEAIDVLTQKISELIGEFLSFRGILKALGLDKIFDLFVGITGKVIGVTAAFIGLSASVTAVNAINLALLTVNIKLVSLTGPIAKLSKSFPILGKIAIRSLAGLNNAIASVGTAFVSTNLKMKATKDAIKSVSKSFWQGLTSTEIFDKGIFGLVSRLTALSGIFSLVGFNMLKSDSLMVKMAGGGIIALTVAMGGLALVLKQLLFLLGSFFIAVGTKMVRAMQRSVDIMAQMQATTTAFTFLVTSLNRETKGVTGTFEEWNEIAIEFSKTQRFGIEETQRSISELLRYGESIGLAKGQMKKMLPIISQLAKANHKDLFQSTLAVVEALSGQTQMLANMTVNLSEHSIASSKAGKAVHGHMKSLTANEKVQVRYNALLEKTASLNGLVEETSMTIIEQLKRQAISIQNINIAMGKGAELIEQKVNVVWTKFLAILENSSKTFLKSAGFLTALTGRALQAIGTFTKWAFTIVLVASAIKGLNIVIKNNYIQKFIGQIATSTLITKKLAGVFPILATAVSSAFTKMSVAGLGFNSILHLTAAGMWAVAKAAWVLIAPFVIILIKVVLVIAALYLLYKAFQVIEKKTKIFSTVWGKMVKLWKESSVIIDTMKESFIWIKNLFKKSFLLTIYGIAYAITGVAESFVFMGRKAVEIIKWLGGKILAFYSTVAKISKKFSLISTAEAAEMETYVTSQKKEQIVVIKKILETEDSIKKVRKSIGADIGKIWRGESLITSEKGRQLAIDQNILATKRDYVEELRAARKAEEAINSQGKARYALAIRDAGSKVGLSGQMSEDLYAGAAAGSADQVKGAVTSGLMNSGNPYAMAVGGIIDIFGKDQEEFKKFAKELSKMAMDLPLQIAENIPVLIDELVKRLPETIDALTNMLPILVDGLMVLFSKPEFWKNIIAVGIKSMIGLITGGLGVKLLLGLVGGIIIGLKKAIDAIFLYVLNPTFWAEIAVVIADTFRIAITAVIKVVASIVMKVLGPVFRFLGGMIKGAANVFKDIGKVFKQAVDLFMQAVNYMKKGGPAGSLWSSVKKGAKKLLSVIGLQNGGVPALMAANMVKAQNGLASVPGHSYTGDKVLAGLNSKEMILNMSQQAKLFNRIMSGEGENKPIVIYAEIPVMINERELGRANKKIEVNGWNR